ncbi:hypothetical protein RFI_30683, partial [Reticulomyxa filosa]
MWYADEACVYAIDQVTGNRLNSIQFSGLSMDNLKGTWYLSVHMDMIDVASHNLSDQVLTNLQQPFQMLIESGITGVSIYLSADVGETITSTISSGDTKYYIYTPTDDISGTNVSFLFQMSVISGDLIFYITNNIALEACNVRLSQLTPNSNFSERPNPLLSAWTSSGVFGVSPDDQYYCSNLGCDYYVIVFCRNDSINGEFELTMKQQGEI